MCHRKGTMKEALKYAAISDRGIVRKSNEDSYACRVPESGWPAIFCVADGMGGHLNGELASKTAVDYCVERMSSDLGPLNQPERVEVLLSDIVQKANVKVYLKSLESRENTGMGTTMTTAVFFADSVYLSHVGDSRCYIMRNGVFEKLSRDHTIVQELMDAGSLTDEEGKNHPQRHVLTQALGVPEYLQPEILHVDLKKHDRYLICSDGLHGVVDQKLIGETLRISADPQSCCEKLLRLALDEGGPDNITCIVVFA